MSRHLRSAGLCFSVKRGRQIKLCATWGANFNWGELQQRRLDREGENPVPHYWDHVQWVFGKDDTSPVEIDVSAPPAHPEVTGMWGWVELRYADGLTFVLESTEWGPRYTRRTARPV